MELHGLSPQSEAMQELVRLVEQEQELRARIGEAERGARAAGQERADAREALTELEREAAVEGVSAQARRKAEDRVTKAEAAVAVWPSRLQGAERAAMDGRHAIQRHIAEHFDTIRAELEAKGAAEAEQVNASAESFLSAVARCTETERTLTEVVSMIRRMAPGDISYPRSQEAVQAIRSFIAQGGETGPRVQIQEQAEAIPEQVSA